MRKSGVFPARDVRWASAAVVAHDRMPCCVQTDIALPSSVFGPVERRALARSAAIFASGIDIMDLASSGCGVAGRIGADGGNGGEER
jgi:hypothetical protein